MTIEQATPLPCPTASEHEHSKASHQNESRAIPSFPIKGLSVGPHVEGFVRFATQRDEVGDLTQQDHLVVVHRAKQFTGDHAEWLEHPLHAHLVQAQQSEQGTADQKLRSIPVKVMFDKPELNFSARYEAWDCSMGRVVCAGNGETAKRTNPDGSREDAQCPGPALCQFANSDPTVRCQMQSTLRVQIDGQGDELSVFEFRTSGVNSSVALHADLVALHTGLGGRIAGVPLRLEVRKRSNAASMGQLYYYVHLKLDNITLAQAASKAIAFANERASAGVSQEWMEAAFAMSMQGSDSDTQYADVEEFYGAFRRQAARAAVGKSSGAKGTIDQPKGVIDMSGVLSALVGRPAGAAENTAKQDAPPAGTTPGSVTTDAAASEPLAF